MFVEKHFPEVGRWRKVLGAQWVVFFLPIQGSHRSGKILKTFSSQGKTGVFQPKSGKKISNQGTFFRNHFQTF